MIDCQKAIHLCVLDEKFLSLNYKIYVIQTNHICIYIQKMVFTLLL